LQALAKGLRIEGGKLLENHELLVNRLGQLSFVLGLTDFIEARLQAEVGNSA